MKLYILGTGHATVLNNYNTCFCLERNNKYLLVDAGGGKQILKQLKDINLDLNQIDSAFITHNHTDHLLGFAWIVRTSIYEYLKGHRTTPLTIYGSEECLKAISDICKITLADLWEKMLKEKFVNFVAISNRDSMQILDTTVEFFDTKAQDMHQMAFSMPDIKFAFCGDMPLDPGYYNKFYNYNCVCLEAFCLESQRAKNELPLKKHYTVLQAANTASRLNAKTAIFWHSDDSKQQDQYLQEIRQHYSGNAIVPNDLDIIDVDER